MAERVKRGYGLGAHKVRMRLLEVMEQAGLLHLVDMQRLKLYGEGHQDYTLQLAERQLILRSGELEPFIAGVEWGMRLAGKKPPEAITDVYRPDAPIRPGQVKANRARGTGRG